MRRDRYHRPSGGDRFLQGEQGRLRRGRAGCADRGRHGRRSQRRRLQGVRPDQGGGRLESSKSFTKALCRDNNIPTAAYEHFTDAEKAKAYIREQGAPIVVKADGLAAGKGVVVAMTEQEALDAVDMMFGGGFGEAGAEVVVEEFMAGEEASFFALCDGEHALPLPPRRTTSAPSTATRARTPAAWAPIRRRRS